MKQLNRPRFYWPFMIILGILFGMMFYCSGLRAQGHVMLIPATNYTYLNEGPYCLQEEWALINTDTVEGYWVADQFIAPQYERSYTFTTTGIESQAYNPPGLQHYHPSSYHPSQLLQFGGYGGIATGYYLKGGSEKISSRNGWINDHGNRHYHNTRDMGELLQSGGLITLTTGIVIEEFALRSQLKKMAPTNPNYKRWEKKCRPGRTALRIGAKLLLAGFIAHTNAQIGYRNF